MIDNFELIKPLLNFPNVDVHKNNSTLLYCL